MKHVLLAGLLTTQVPSALVQTADWEEDVHVLLAAVAEIHPKPYRLHGPERWEDEAYALMDALPDLEPHEAVLGLQRLLALAGDGHTEAVDTPHASLRGRLFPLHIRRFEDGWFVRTGHRDYAELFGKRFESLAGVPIEEVVSRLRPFVAADNEIGALDGIGNLMRHPSALHAAGVTSQRVEVIEIVAVGPDGERVTVEVAANDDPWVTAEWSDSDAASTSPKPLYRSMDGNYSFEHLPDESMVYVYFDKVRDESEESIAAFFGRVFDFIDENGVERLILDIRENSGGNNYLNLPVIHGVLRSRVNRPGHFFVVIGRDTYSAAMGLAVDLEKHTNVLFVGEPTGGAPNHCGDTREVRLPKSGLVVEISELYWQPSDPRDRRPWITPDLPAPLSSADFFARHDPALAAIREYIATADPSESFGMTNTRWQRPSQTLEQVWPGLAR